MTSSAGPRVVGRYVIGGILAQGGMAAVHVGLARGVHGFTRPVAIKRMLPHFAGDPQFASMFADEARLAARIRHPNVVPTFDVVAEGEDLCIVMEYVHGLTLSQLLKAMKARGKRVPPDVAATLLRDALEGLHAAHEAVDEDGHPLGIVHRDVSPQNILVGADGVARVLDFGIARANVRLHETRTGDSLKGKLAYMAPEQLEGRPASRASDVFAASVVLWETLTGERLYHGTNEGEIVTKILHGAPPAPSAIAPELGTTYDAVVLRGLARGLSDRFATAREMSLALTECGPTAAAPRLAEWMEQAAGALLAERAARIRALEEPLRAPPDVAPPPDAEATRSAVEVFTPRAAPPRRSRMVLAIVAAFACASAAATMAVRARTGAETAKANASVQRPPSPAAAPATSMTAPSPVVPFPVASATPAASTTPASVESVAPPVVSAPAPRPRAATPRAHASAQPTAPALPDHL